MLLQIVARFERRVLFFPLPDKEVRVGSSPDNEIVLEPSGLLHNPTKQCLVGSSATMFQCMNHLASLDILSLDDMLTVGFHNPLALIHAKPADLRAGGAVTYDPSARKFTFAAGA